MEAHKYSFQDMNSRALAEHLDVAISTVQRVITLLNSIQFLVYGQEATGHKVYVLYLWYQQWMTVPVIIRMQKARTPS